MMESIQDKAKELRCKSNDIMDSVCLVVTASLKALGMCDTISENAYGSVESRIMKCLEGHEMDTTQEFEKDEKTEGVRRR